MERLGSFDAQLVLLAHVEDHVVELEPQARFRQPQLRILRSRIRLDSGRSPADGEAQGRVGAQCGAALHGVNARGHRSLAVGGEGFARGCDPPQRGQQAHALGTLRKSESQLFRLLEGQPVAELDLLGARVDGAPEAQAAPAAFEGIAAAAERRLDLAGSVRQVELQQRGRLAAQLGRYVHDPLRAVVELVGVMHTQIAAARLEAQRHFPALECIGIGAGFGDRDLQRVLLLIRCEFEAAAEGHTAESRPHQVHDVRRVREALEDDPSLGVGLPAPQTGSSGRGERVEDHLRAGHGSRAALVHELDPYERVAGRRLWRPRLCGCHGRQAERKEASRELALRAAHSRRRSVRCGHITAMVPTTKIMPPIQIQLTRGLR